MFFQKEIVIGYGSIRLACRGEGCGRTDMDWIDDLDTARRAGWANILKVAGTLMPLPTRWWDYLGTCPQCIDRGEVNEID